MNDKVLKETIDMLYANPKGVSKTRIQEKERIPFFDYLVSQGLAEYYIPDHDFCVCPSCWQEGINKEKHPKTQEDFWHCPECGTVEVEEEDLVFIRLKDAYRQILKDNEVEMNISQVVFTQGPDGYSESHDRNKLKVSLLDGAVILQTVRWCATPNELRELADKIEKLLEAS